MAADADATPKDAREGRTSSLRRARRLQVLQAAILLLLGIGVVVTALLFGRQILDGQSRVNREQRQARELNELRGQLRQAFITFWVNRFEGRAGISPEVQSALAAGVIEINRLAAEAPSDPAVRAAIGETSTALGRLGTIIGGDYDAFAIGSPEDRRAVNSGRAAVDRLDAAVVLWAERASELAERHAADLRQVTRTLVRWLVGLVGLLGAVGIGVWWLLERTRGRIVKEMQVEHAERGAVIASVQDGLAVIGADGAISEVNQRLANLTGYTRAQLAGSSDLPYLHGTGVEADLVGERDLEITRPDGTRVPVILSASPLEGADGTTSGRVHVVKDVTERKRAEEELRRLAAEQDALRRAATEVAAGVDPLRVFELVAEEVALLLEVEGGMVSRFDRETGRAECVGSWLRATGPPRPLPSRVPLDGDVAIGIVYRSGLPARVVAKPGDDELFAAHGYPVTVSAPVRVGSDVWGAVTAAASSPDLLPPGTEIRLARFAELVGITVANADARARLAAQAATDALTGLANHRTFHERLHGEVERARRERSPLALVVFDLDHFKDVNDAYGHQVGDEVLSEFARRLAGEARFGELVARLGGEEFGWLLPGSDGLNAWKAAERVRRAISSSPFGARVGRLTVSAGVCELSHASDGDELLRLADGALYWAKSSGRDVAVTYSPEVVKELSVEERAERLARTQAVTALRALARAVDAKDPNTARHAERVAANAVDLADALGWSPERIGLLNEAALLHDVGKIGVPDAILLKTERLDPVEYERIKSHAALGADIVSDVLSAEQVQWVRGHHERWDGRGYPDGLAGKDISEGGQILAVADAWDAMTSVRTYQATRCPAAALEECREGSGTQFSPRVVEALEGLLASGALGGPPPASTSAPAGP